MDVMAHTTVDSGFGSRRQQLPEVSQRQFRLPAYSVDLTATAVLVPASGHAPELAAQGPAAPGVDEVRWARCRSVPGFSGARRQRATGSSGARRQWVPGAVPAA